MSRDPRERPDLTRQKVLKRAEKAKVDYLQAVAVHNALARADEDMQDVLKRLGGLLNGKDATAVTNAGIRSRDRLRTAERRVQELEGISIMLDGFLK